MSSPVGGPLAVLASLLLAVIVYELEPTNGPGLQHLPAVSTPVALTSAVSDVSYQGAVLDQLKALSARPLFNPNRRPIPEPQKAPNVPLPRLSGVIIGSGIRNAIFSPLKSGKSIIVSEGDTIGNYLVLTIQPTGVRVQFGSTLRDVKLSGVQLVRGSLPIFAPTQSNPVIDKNEVLDSDIPSRPLSQ